MQKLVSSFYKLSETTRFVTIMLAGFAFMFALTSIGGLISQPSDLAFYGGLVLLAVVVTLTFYVATAVTNHRDKDNDKE